MINHNQLRQYIIKPTLDSLGLYSRAAEELLVFTACAESDCGTWLHQKYGPAAGIFQMEPRTHDDIWKNYLSHRKPLANKVASFSKDCLAIEMIWNLKYAAAMCRVHYLRSSRPLPQEFDGKGMAQYWKDIYNTHKGKGDPDHALSLYRAMTWNP